MCIEIQLWVEGLPNTLAVRHPKGSGRIYAIFHPIAHRKSDASLGLKASVVFTVRVPAINVNKQLRRYSVYTTAIVRARGEKEER